MLCDNIMATSASQSQYGATTDVVATSSPQPLPASQPSATPAAAQGERSTAESNDNPQVEEVQAKAAATGTQQARYWRLEGAHTRVKDVGRSVALPTSRPTSISLRVASTFLAVS